MGSLCCVAARPHGSNTASRDWSVGPREPFWRTNSSFSPPPPRWDFRFQSEGLQYGLHDGVPFYGSSTSSNSKDSRSWAGGNTRHQYAASDGPGLLLSSPSDLSQGLQWTPPAIQEINADEYEITARQGNSHDPGLGPFCTRPNIEGASENLESEGASSSSSESSESEPTVKMKSSSYRSIAGRCSFMSKPIHPLSLPTFSPVDDFFNSTLPEFLELDSTTSQRDMRRWSSASSSIDFADNSEPFELENFTRSDGVRCGLCEKFLSQRSPWSSRRIVRSRDMPVAGVLSCRHVFHAECLEQTTPKTRKNDPPCPLCIKNDHYSPEQKTNLRLKSTLPRLRPFSEDGPSRPWGCTQVGDCVEGALHAPPRNTTLLLNRNRGRKSVSSKGSKEFPGKLRKNGSNLSHPFRSRSFDHGMVECSKASSIDSSRRDDERCVQNRKD